MEPKHELYIFQAVVVQENFSLIISHNPVHALLVLANLHHRPGDKVDLALPIKDHTQDRAKIIEIIKRMQAGNAFSSIKDPVAWQREIREDRPLPGRD